MTYKGNASGIPFFCRELLLPLLLLIITITFLTWMAKKKKKMENSSLQSYTKMHIENVIRKRVKYYVLLSLKRYKIPII